MEKGEDSRMNHKMLVFPIAMFTDDVVRKEPVSDNYWLSLVALRIKQNNCRFSTLSNHSMWKS